MYQSYGCAHCENLWIGRSVPIFKALKDLYTLENMLLALILESPQIFTEPQFHNFKYLILKKSVDESML